MRALVTGGGGFLGSAIVDVLLRRGDDVRVLGRGEYPALAERGVVCIRTDVRDADAVTAAATGCDVVFHVAAKAGMWGRYSDYYEANVIGTRAVLAACRRAGVSRLVHTSTPSVVHGGASIAGGDESLPYATHYSSPYPATKAIAERDVLAANDDDLTTVALRPHLIWGPGDGHLMPRMHARARAGRLALVGDGSNLVDSVYIDNAATAHVLAADRLAPGAPAAGRAYFISQGDPRPLRELVDGIVTAAGLPPVSKTVPFPVAYAAGAMSEVLASLRLAVTGREKEPLMTRFLARQLATDHWFDISAARRDLGYSPQIDIDEGLRRLRKWLAVQPVT